MKVTFEGDAQYVIREMRIFLKTVEEEVEEIEEEEPQSLDEEE